MHSEDIRSVSLTTSMSTGRPKKPKMKTSCLLAMANCEWIMLCHLRTRDDVLKYRHVYSLLLQTPHPWLMMFMLKWSWRKIYIPNCYYSTVCLKYVWKNSVNGKPQNLNGFKFEGNLPVSSCRIKIRKKGFSI